MKFSSFWIVVFLIQSGFVLSQTIKEHDNRVWAGYMTEAKINDKFSLWNDTHWMPESFFLLRTGLTFHFDSRFKATTTLGYGRLWIYPSEKEFHTFRPEHRIWGQTTFARKYGALRHFFRFRYEARFRHKLANDELLPGYNFNWRLRWLYQIRYDFPAKDDAKNHFYSVVSDEFLLHAGKEIKNDFRMDQNRLTFALGYQMENISMQLGYMNIVNQSNTKSDLFMKHTLVFWVFHKMDFRKKEPVLE